MSNRLFGIAVTIGAAILMMAVPVDCAWAEKKVALVIGNSNYENVPKLPNPSRDAISVGQMLRDAGFDVNVIANVSGIEFKRAIRKFEVDSDQSDIAVVFYAGHGLEIGGTNYLIPVDARLASDRDADDEAITLDRVVSSADGASKLRIIILDACRDNPFTSLMRRERKGSNRVVSSGLGKAEPTSTDTLIAYAAKAGSTAEDGDGTHSPFTAAILKNLTQPGLDIRLAFGRVRDDVMRTTGSRQEPFVYGSLGGGNISLVPAPKVQETSIADVKADYELVARIGTLKAWEVFVGTHRTGFYADLARVQIAALSEQQQPQGPTVTRSPSNSNMVVAGVPSAPQPGGRESSSQETLDWNRIKDSTDSTAFEKFIQKYPDAPLAVTAKNRLEILQRAAAEREAARKAAEQIRVEAERKKAEIAAAKKREEDERRAREAEAAEKARVAAAELAAAKKRDEEERRAKAAEAEQKARAAEAERKATEAKRKAEQAERDRAAAEAAAQRFASERQAKEAEQKAKAAEAEQKAKAAEAERVAAEERRRTEQATKERAAAEAAQQRAAREKEARDAEEARKAAEVAARDAVCKTEQGKLDALIAKGSNGSGMDDLKAFAKSTTCDRLGGQIAVALDKFGAEEAKRAAVMPNSPQLVTAAQTQLVRLGCVIPGKPDGILNDPTKAALTRFMAVKNRKSDKLEVTSELVSELSAQTDRICAVECKANEIVKEDKCVVRDKPPPPAATSRRKDDDDTPARRKSQPEKRQAEKETRRPAPAPEPRARQQAVARPSGGGGGGSMIGVGF